MKTLFKYIVLSIALVTAATTAQAQVKIGSNPTIIGAGSNLEVEATNGKKVIVDKAVGTVQVQNLPAGAATDNIVTADAAGVLRQRSISAITTLSGSAVMTSGEMPLTNAGQNYPIDFTADPFNPDGVGDVTNNRFDINETGWYTINGKAVGLISSQIPGGFGHFSLDLYVNGAYVESTYLYQPAGMRILETLNVPLIYLTAGTKVSFTATACYGCSAGNAGYVVESTTIFLQRQY